MTVQSPLLEANALTEEILASHFSLGEIPGELTLLDPSGVDGWVSSNPHPVLSIGRWTTTDGTLAEAGLEAVMSEFREAARGFDWMTGPRTEHLIPLLYERGFVAPPLCVAAMARDIPQGFLAPSAGGLRVWRVEDLTDQRVADIMSRGFDVPLSVGRLFHNAYLTPSDKQVSEVYAAGVDDTDTPVGGGYLSYLGAGDSVLLRVSSTAEGYRGRGVYRALVLHRLQEAAERGRRRAFVHAYSSKSQRVLQDLGFEQTGKLQLHRWRP